MPKSFDEWKAENATAIKPDHYKRWGAFEPIKVIRAWRLNFNLGNAIKYISRAGYKEDNSMIQDLEKAKEYPDIEIAMLKEECNE